MSTTFLLWQSFLELTTFSLGAGAVIVILVSSDGKIVGTWAGGLQPNTLIAISALLSNLLLGFAFTQGLVLSYWKFCLHGSSLKGLHCHWKAGQSAIGAVQAVWQGRSLVNAIAFLGWALYAMRSPLNQSAAGIENNVSFPNNGTMQLLVAQALPDGYTGITPNERQTELTTAGLTQSFLDVMRAYNLQAPITLPHADCGDSCDTTIRAFGFCVNCTTTSHSVSPPSTAQDDKELPLFQSAVAIWAQGFSQNDNVSPGYLAGLNFSLLFSMDPINTARNASDRTVNQTTRVCYLQPSTLSQSIQLTNNNTVTLSKNWQDDTCVHPLNYLGPYTTIGGPTTVGGFQFVASQLFSSSAAYTFGGAVSNTRLDGMVSNLYLGPGQQNSISFGNPYLTWNDPTDDILNAIRDISFRTSVYAAVDKGINSTSYPNATTMFSNQSVAYNGTSLHITYKTSYGPMIAALVVSVVGILAVGLLYVGWWELGRTVTMSPLELALAFDAPLLGGLQGNSEIDDIVEQADKRRIRYGEVDVHGTDSNYRLMLADTKTARRPREGIVYK